MLGDGQEIRHKVTKDSSQVTKDLHGTIKGESSCVVSQQELGEAGWVVLRRLSRRRRSRGTVVAGVFPGAAAPVNRQKRGGLPRCCDATPTVHGGAGAMDAGAMGALPTRDELFDVLLKGKQLEQTMKDRQAGGGAKSGRYKKHDTA